MTDLQIREEERPCNTVEDLKYRLVRFLIDSADVQIVERASVLRLQSGPLRLATCNLHGLQTKQGVTALVKEVRARQYITSNFPLSRADTDERRHHADVWIESGSVSFGPVFIEGATSSGGHGGQIGPGHREQSEFLQRHDGKTRKLWFLWPNNGGKIPGGSGERSGKCGCIGGCEFFGQNSSGVKFFEPEERDLSARKNVAVPCIRPRSADDPGYGQSILAENQLVVHGYTSFGVGLDLVLPEGWPHSCRQPRRLPFCPDYRTHKSSSSHNSGDTPKHPKYHRSFSAKHGGGGTPMTAARKRSAMLDALRGRHSATGGSTSRLSSEATPSKTLIGEDTMAMKASSLVEVNSDEASSSAAASSSSSSPGNPFY